jgi:hypothetical protein
VLKALLKVFELATKFSQNLYKGDWESVLGGSHIFVKVGQFSFLHQSVMRT